MTILNDKEIRKLCMVPTHCLDHQLRYGFYSKVGDIYYSLDDGKAYVFDNPEQIGLIPIKDEDIDQFKQRMITPFVPHQVRTRLDNAGIEEKIISYGTSSMGYDVTLDKKFKIFTNTFNALIDPLNMPDNAYIDYEGDCVIIPPNSYILGHTVETFNIPRDITAICVGKSTYARAACSVNITPIEAGFKGQVVIEIANLSTLPMKVYSGMGISQFIFLRGNECEISYEDRGGKYQNQVGIQTALV